MEDWKDDLQETLNTLVLSKKVSNYDKTVNEFRCKFNELTDGFRKSEPSLFPERNHKGNTYFYINKHALCLIDEGHFIRVVARDESKTSSEVQRTILAEILFNDGFSFIRYKDTQRDLYFGEKDIENLFKQAYKPMI